MVINKKLIARIIIYFFVLLCICVACFLYYFGDINKLKKNVEKNLKEQLTCTIKLGILDWDWDGIKLGVSTSNISLYDRDNNLVLQAGPTRFVWDITNIITGSYAHFYKIDSTDLYLNAIRNKNNSWNLIEMFPPGPPPKVDNLELHNSIIYLIDELAPPSNKKALYKDLNINWEKKSFSRVRKIDFVTRVGSLKGLSFVKVKGIYTERKKFDWKKSEFDLSVLAKNVNLANWQGYLISLVKEPELRKMDGEFTGKVHLYKRKGEKEIKVKSITKTNNFLIAFNTKEVSQIIEIPKTDLIINALIDQNKIDIKSFRSNIDELSYELNGFIYNWSKSLPEVDLTFKTNKFNFKSVKPFLPLSLLPASTRARIEPINDDGLVEIDLMLKGPAIAPKYEGTILLDKFNLTSESGFLEAIKGLQGKLVLDNDILRISYLNIPVEDSLLVLRGEVDNLNLKTHFNLNGKGLHIRVLQELINQSSFQLPIANNIASEGKLDLNIDVTALKDTPPEIKGKISFHNAGISIIQSESLEIKNVLGDLLLDGSKVIFNNLSGLINNENFSIHGDFSLKEDEKVNLSVNAEHLKIIRYLLSFITSKTSFKPVSDSISGEFSNLNLNIGGTLSNPILNGIVSINDVSFSLPNLQDKISNISGNLKFERSDLVIDSLNGKIQNANFGIVGYIQNLFNHPKPNLRLVTGDIELKSFWNYAKEHLKTTSLKTQAEALEKLEGIAALDLFVHPDAVLGNVYFKDGKIKYKLIPFDLNNLAGRLVIGEKNLSLFGFMGSINDSNDFISDLTVFNYLDPAFNIQGMLSLNLNLPAIIKAFNAPALDTIKINGLIPTLINFDISLPIISCGFYSTLDEMLKLDLPPYIKKPETKSYILSGNIDLDSKNMDLYLKQFNIMSDKLSLTTTGSIKNISSKNPEVMFYFNTDEPAGLFMIIEPIAPLMGYKIWGMIELSGAVSGTPSMYAVSSNAKLKNVELPELLGKKLTAEDGTVSLYLDNEQGVINSKINNVNYVSLNAKAVSLSANYLNPVIYLNELSLDSNPGSIFATGSFDPRDNAVSFDVSGSDLELSKLGSFIFLDPTKISGKTDFVFMIDGKGKTKDEIISNSNGNLSFSISDGMLGQVALLQKGIQLANLFSQGIFGFNLTNVFSLFFKYQDGSFNSIKGALDLNKGIIKANELIYRAKDLFLNSFGFIDLNNSFVGLSFYGYLPQRKEQAVNSDQSKNDTQYTSTSPIAIIPDTLGKRRFFIPFLSSNPPQYFKFEVKGGIKEPKKITGHARRSFRWLKGKHLKKEYKYIPRAEN